MKDLSEWIVIMTFIFGLAVVFIRDAGKKPKSSSNVAKAGRENGVLDNWKAPAMPPEIQPVMFEDGHVVTAAEISAKGFEVLVDEDGRVIYVREAKRGAALIPVEEWCGFIHGARLS
jgi:hypothetical protein